MYERDMKEINYLFRHDGNNFYFPTILTNLMMPFISYFLFFKSHYPSNSL